MIIYCDVQILRYDDIITLIKVMCTNEIELVISLWLTPAYDILPLNRIHLYSLKGVILCNL